MKNIAFESNFFDFFDVSARLNSPYLNIRGLNKYSKKAYFKENKENRSS